MCKMTEKVLVAHSPDCPGAEQVFVNSQKMSSLTYFTVDTGFCTLDSGKKK